MNEAVRISYRNHLNEAWTVLKNFDYATYQEEIMETSIALKCSSLQIKIELQTTTTTTPELLTVILR